MFDFNLLSLFSMIFRIIFIFLAHFSFLLTRLLDTTDPSFFLKDGKTVNFCNLPKLDVPAKSADDIPKTYTPRRGYSQIPMPILAECTEPLADGVIDTRGLWQGVSGRSGFLERISNVAIESR